MVEFKEVKGHAPSLSAVAEMLVQMEHERTEVAEIKVEANGQEGGFDYKVTVAEGN